MTERFTTITLGAGQRFVLALADDAEQWDEATAFSMISAAMREDEACVVTLGVLAAAHGCASDQPDEIARHLARAIASGALVPIGHDEWPPRGMRPAPQTRDDWSDPIPLSTLREHSSAKEEEPTPPVPEPVPISVAFDFEDITFGTERAVLLPETVIEHRLDRPQLMVRGISAVAAVLAFARTNPGHALVVLGHTDDVGGGSSDAPLSDARAENVQLYLEGDLDAWARHSMTVYAIEDVQHVLAWTARTFAWDCDPGAIDNEIGSVTMAALGRFRKRHAAEHEATAIEGESIRVEDWRAFADIYDRALEMILRTPPSPLRSALRWLEPKRIACGTDHRRRQIPGASIEGTDRRVEIVLCSPEAKTEIGGRDPGHVIHDTTHRLAYIPVDVLVIGETTHHVHAQLFDHWTVQALAGVEYSLRGPLPHEPIVLAGVTDAQGTLHAIDLLPGHYRIEARGSEQLVIALPTAGGATHPKLPEAIRLPRVGIERGPVSRPTDPAAHDVLWRVFDYAGTDDPDAPPTPAEIAQAKAALEECDDDDVLAPGAGPRPPIGPMVGAKKTKRATKTERRSKLIKITAPADVTQATPIEITFTDWPADADNVQVTVEILENSGKLLSGVFTDDDEDLAKERLALVTVTGTMVRAADGTARLTGAAIVAFEPTADVRDIAYVGFPGSDLATQRFGMRSATNAKPAAEGAFFELTARVRSPSGIDEESTLAAVRRRSDLLLAVEPMAQGSSQMSDLGGKQSLAFFHPGEEDAHRSRGWGEVILRNYNLFAPATLKNSGCSYLIATMLLTYLREAAPDGAHVTLFEKYVIGGVRSAAARPFQITDPVRTVAGGGETIDEKARTAFFERYYEHFFPDDAKKLMAAISAGENRKPLSKKAAKGLRGAEYRLWDRFRTTRKGEPLAPPAYVSSPEIAVEWFPAMVLWLIREAAGLIDEDYGTDQGVWLLPRSKGPSTEDTDPAAVLAAADKDRIDAVRDDGVTVWTERLRPANGKNGFTDDVFLVLPFMKPTLALLGLTKRYYYQRIAKVTAHATLPTELASLPLVAWETQVLRALHDGLPICALFKRGGGGHWCLIVGYSIARHGDGVRVRFIINDPAYSASTQYPVAFADEVNVEEKNEVKATHLVYERRNRMPLLQIAVYEPAGWTADLARHLHFRPAAP